MTRHVIIFGFSNNRGNFKRDSLNYLNSFKFETGAKISEICPGNEVLDIMTEDHFNIPSVCKCNRFKIIQDRNTTANKGEHVQ